MIIPLLSGALPTDEDGLDKELTRGLAELFELPGDHSTVRCADRSEVGLEELVIDLDGAVVREAALGHLKDLSVAEEPVLQVARLSVRGAPMHALGASLTFEMTGSRVAFGLATAGAGAVLLAPISLSEGSLSIRMAQADLEKALFEGAQRLAGSLGASVEQVDLELEQIGDRELGPKDAPGHREAAGEADPRREPERGAHGDSGSRGGQVGCVARSATRPLRQSLRGLQLPALSRASGNPASRDASFAGERWADSQGHARVSGLIQRCLSTTSSTRSS